MAGCIFLLVFLISDHHLSTCLTVSMLSRPAFLLAISLCTGEAVCHITRSINWFPCTQNGTLPITCGTLTVPLDYVDTTSNATLELQLVKVSAVKQPKKGSILFNPGGPGSPGRLNPTAPDCISIHRILPSDNHGQRKEYLRKHAFGMPEGLESSSALAMSHAT